jgi:hypothetical protein
MNFPNRPDHPDFWLMAECVQDLDAAADDGVSYERIIGPVDIRSLTYMATQRALRINVPGGLTLAYAGAGWIDGFMAGVNFQKRRGLQNPE